MSTRNVPRNCAMQGPMCGAMECVMLIARDDTVLEMPRNVASYTERNAKSN